MDADTNSNPQGDRSPVIVEDTFHVSPTHHSIGSFWSESEKVGVLTQKKKTNAISQLSKMEKPEVPTIYIHRHPSYTFSLTTKLTPHFNLLDPLLTDPTPFLRSIRALLCVALTPLTYQTIASLPALQLVVASGVGVDHIDLHECRRRGIAVTNAGNAFSEDVADIAVGLLVDVFRRVSASDRFIRSGFWPIKGDYPLGFKLRGKRIGILGLGSIGSLVAKRLSAFGCSIAYNSRKKKPSVSYPYFETVQDLAANSDVLIACCSLTKETHHIINKDVMSALGKQGVIINVGRGALVDEKQLVEFLVRGELGGAGLDVFEDEPNVPKELFELDSVALSPHCAPVTPEAFEALQDVMLENLKAFFSNKPLISPVQND